MLQVMPLIQGDTEAAQQADDYMDGRRGFGNFRGISRDLIAKELDGTLKFPLVPMVVCNLR